MYHIAAAYLTLCVHISLGDDEYSSLPTDGATIGIFVGELHLNKSCA